MTTVTYQIPNISCNHCVRTIEMNISGLEGVESVHADADEKTATIKFEDPATEEKLKDKLAEIHYPVAE
jgi:copper chaperone CopZ